MGTPIDGKPHTSPLVGDEKVPLSPDGFATTQEIADLGGGGSGLPPQWTDGGNGDVTATVDDPTKTAFELLAAEDQEEAPLIITSDTEPGSADLFLVRQSVDKGGRDILSVDDSGEVDLHVVEPNVRGLNIDEDVPEPGQESLFIVTGSVVNRAALAEVLAEGLPDGSQVSARFDGGLRFQYDNGPVSDAFWVFDPVANTTTLKAHPGQDIDAPQLLIKDELGHEMWSLAQEPDAAGVTHHIGLRDSTDSDWNALFYIHLDNHEAGSQYQEAAFALGTFHNGNAILFDTFWNEAAPADNYTNLAIRRFDEQTVPIVTISEQVGNDRLFVVGKAGAIGTSAGEPADGDILPGECFRYFIPTNGAAKTGFKGKTLDGTVVKREDSIP